MTNTESTSPQAASFSEIIPGLPVSVPSREELLRMAKQQAKANATDVESKPVQLAQTIAAQPGLSEHYQFLLEQFMSLNATLRVTYMSLVQMEKTPHSALTVQDVRRAMEHSVRLAEQLLTPPAGAAPQQAAGAA